MYKKRSARMEEITPKRCELLLKLNTLPEQRPYDLGWAQALAQTITNDTFRDGEIGIAHFDGKEILVNGQHQLNAGIISGKTFTAMVEHFDCESGDDLWMLYGSYDGHKPRSARQIIRYARRLFSSEDLGNVPLDMLSKCGSALLALGSGTKPVFGRSNRVAKTKMAQLLQDYEADVMTIAAYQEKELRKLMTVPVVTAMIATFRTNQGKATAFWDRVLYGDNLERNSPQWKLHTALINGARALRPANVGIGTGGCKGNGMMYSLCVAWWNSYITGEPRSNVKLGALTKIPDVLGGKR